MQTPLADKEIIAPKVLKKNRMLDFLDSKIGALVAPILPNDSSVTAAEMRRQNPLGLIIDKSNQSAT